MSMIDLRMKRAWLIPSIQADDGTGKVHARPTACLFASLLVCLPISALTLSLGWERTHTHHLFGCFIACLFAYLYTRFLRWEMARTRTNQAKKKKKKKKIPTVFRASLVHTAGQAPAEPCIGHSGRRPPLAR